MVVYPRTYYTLRDKHRYTNMGYALLRRWTIDVYVALTVLNINIVRNLK